ncbi:hypothetical protein ABTM93_19795, partial [Acinetobacter baumannii]
ALAFTAASSKTDQLAIAELIDAHGRDGFASAWLHHRGVAWAAELLPGLISDPDGPDAGQPELPLDFEEIAP